MKLMIRGIMDKQKM